MENITVAIADPGRAGERTCEQMLQGDSEITVIGRDVNSSDLVASLLALRPRILLFSLDLCNGGDCSMLRMVRRDCPDTRVVLLANAALKEEHLIHALATGAVGYLEYNACERHLAKAVHCVDRGEAWVPRSMLGKMMERILH